MKGLKQTSAVICVILAAAVLALSADKAAPSEEQVKAAFLFNFIRFVDWPDGAFAEKTAPIVIGILGEDALGREIERFLRGKSVQGRKLLLRKLEWPGEIKGCHILMVPASGAKAAPEILASVKENPVLTVGETDRFSQQGGIINFYLEGNKVRFAINIEAAERAKLKISSQLLGLAKIIRDDPRAGRM